jgi:hypothetical protein
LWIPFCAGYIVNVITYHSSYLWKRKLDNIKFVYVNVTHHSMNNNKFVYVNVTHHSMNNVQFSNCLCECCSLTISSLKMFINVAAWQYSVLKLFTYSMNNIKFSNCLCECYRLTISSSQIVYVNVTAWQYQVLKLFI